jgi:hypothetical protein
MMCKELVRTAAEKEAAAAILVELAKSTPSSPASTVSGPSAVAAATMATAPAKTTTDSAAKEASCGKMRALCSAVNLVNSTLRLLSLRACYSEATVGRRQEDDTLVVGERVQPQPESVGVAPQPCDVDAAPVVVANVPEPAGDVPACYAYRHSWQRRRRNVPVVADGDDDYAAAAVAQAAVMVPEPAGDGPACYEYRHSWRRRRNVPVVARGGDDDDDDNAAPVTSEAGAVRSTGGRTARIRVVVAGVVVGTCEAVVGPCKAAPVAAENSLDQDEDLPPLEEVDASSSSSTSPLACSSASWTSKKPVAVAVSSDEPEQELVKDLCWQEYRDVHLPMIEEARRVGWQERLRRPGRGALYAAAMEAMQPQRRGGGGEGGGRRRRA